MDEKMPKELNDFYDSLEGLKSLNIWNIHKELRTAGKIEGKGENEIIWERKALNYNINKGVLCTNVQTTDIEGKIIEFNLINEELEYFKKRLNLTNNSWLKSRYAHIIWHNTKHQDFAEIAIDNYIKTINRIKKEEATELPIILSAILYLSKNTKKGIKQAKDAAITLIRELPSWLKPTILDTILDNNILSSEELNTIADSIPQWIVKDNAVSYFQNKQNLESGIKLYKKLNRCSNTLYELLAYNEDLILEQHKDDSNFVKFTTLGAKANYFRKAGQKDKSNEILQEYNRLKQIVTLGKISIGLSEKENQIFNEFLTKQSDWILKMSPEQILAFFSESEEILVDPKDIEEQAQKTIKNSIHHLFSTSVFDINSNYKNLNDSEKLDVEILKNYAIGHGIRCESLFLKVFVNGVISGKLNYYSILSFLEKHTWFGRKFERKMTDNKLDKSSSWLTMLAPGIHNFISQHEMAVLMHTNKINNFILAIDSLTLKFEGALRDFIRITGGNTTTQKKGILREQLLEELLQNPTTKKYFTEKDIGLFKYVFTENRGKNLRNNVAHSFLQFSDYSLEVATKVFFCILRLGKYTFEEEHAGS